MLGQMSRFAFIAAGVLMAAYCLSCWALLEIRNNKVPCGVLQQYHREYADGGSMKWRFGPGTDARKPLHAFITSFGLFVYPVALVGMALFGARLFREPQRPFSLFVNFGLRRYFGAVHHAWRSYSRNWIMTRPNRAAPVNA